MTAETSKWGPLLAVAGSVLLLATSQVAFADTEVTTCGQTVAGNAYLGADLDCTGLSVPAVVLDGGTFDLRGHALTAADNYNGVVCPRSCTVTSSVAGGKLMQAAGFGTGIRTDAGPNELLFVRVSDLTIDGFHDGADAFNLVASNVTVTNAMGNALDAVRLRASHVTIDGAGYGFFASELLVSDSTVTNATNGLFGGSLRLDRVTVTGATGIGVKTFRAVIRDSHIDDNPGTGIDVESGDFGLLKLSSSTVSGNGQRGIDADAKVKLKNTSVTDNGLEGIYNMNLVRLTDGSVVAGNGLDGVWVDDDDCPRLTVRESTVTGNGIDATCGVSRTCADLSSCAAPSVAKSTCDHSYDTTSGFPGSTWDVCTLD